MSIFWIMPAPKELCVQIYGGMVLTLQTLRRWILSGAVSQWLN